MLLSPTYLFTYHQPPTVSLYVRFLSIHPRRIKQGFRSNCVSLSGTVKWLLVFAVLLPVLHLNYQTMRVFEQPCILFHAHVLQ